MAEHNHFITYDISLSGHGTNGLTQEMYNDIVETIIIFTSGSSVTVCVVMTERDDSFGDEVDVKLLLRGGILFLAIIKRHFTIICHLDDVDEAMRYQVMDDEVIERL